MKTYRFVSLVIVFFLLFVFQVPGVEGSNLEGIHYTLRVIDFKPTPQQTGEIFNSGTITIGLFGNDLSSSEFPGNGHVWFETVSSDGQVSQMEINVGWEWNGEENCWTFDMAVSKDTTRIWMEEDNLTLVPVSWKGYGPWEVSDSGGAFELKESITYPNYMLMGLDRGITAIGIDPPWITVEMQNLNLIFESEACGVQEYPLTGGIYNAMPVDVSTDSDVEESNVVKLVFRTQYGDDVVWVEKTNVRVPSCNSDVPAEDTPPNPDTPTAVRLANFEVSNGRNVTVLWVAISTLLTLILILGRKNFYR